MVRGVVDGDVKDISPLLLYTMWQRHCIFRKHHKIEEGPTTDPTENIRWLDGYALKYS